MRAFKFRAYYKMGDRYENLEYQDTRPHEVFKWAHEGQPVEIVQFTGLLDCMGKEIYEGDIIDYGPWSGSAKGKGRCLHIVVWREDAASFGTHEPVVEKCTYGAVCQSGEVIGNIYENPELLEAK